MQLSALIGTLLKNTTHAACLEFAMAGVPVEIPDAAVVAVRKPVPDDPLLSTTVAATLRHQPGNQRRRTDVDLKPLIHCKPCTDRR